jgi:hypothetical protein
MDESLRVRGIECVRDLAADREGTGRVERVFRAQEPSQIRSGDEAHREVEATGDVTGVVDRHDVWMLERNGELCLPGEAFAEAFVECQLGRDELQRHSPLQAQVVGPVDDAHPAAADLLLDAIADELGARLNLGLRDRPRLGNSFGVERRKVAPQPGDVQLKQPLEAIEVLEAVRAEVANRHAGKPFLQELACRVREKHLSTVGDHPDPRRTMQTETLLADDRLVRVNSHADKHLDALRPCVLGQGALCKHSRAECPVGPLEREEERVALVVDLAAALLLDGFPQDSVMLSQGGGIALAQLLQELSRALDVGEEERNCAGWQIRRSSFSLRLLHVLRVSSSLAGIRPAIGRIQDRPSSAAPGRRTDRAIEC